MKGVLFDAGLGDVVRTIYQTAGYRLLCESTEPVRVLLASNNPFSSEIFRFHRNARNFILVELAHKYSEYVSAGMRGAEINRALCAFAGLNYEDLVTGPAEGYRPQFDAPDDIESDGHIVFQPFSGNAYFRNLPWPLLERMVALLRAQPHPVFLITRSYFRQGTTGRQIHGVEDARRFSGGNITALDNLSAPATLNLVKRSRCFVGSWSCLQQASWFENKPVAVYYPVDHVDVRDRTDYAFGLDREDCLHSGYPQADMTKLKEWLERWST